MNNKKGFTLAEAMVALLLSAIIIAAVYTVFATQEKIYSVQDQICEMQQNCRVGLDRMVKDLRMAGYDPSGSTTAGIVTAKANFIRIIADLDGDGIIDADEDISYYLYDSGNDNDLDLGRKIRGASVQPLVENISSSGLQFRYFDVSSNELSAPVTTLGLVRKIEVCVTAQTEKPYQNTGKHLTRTLKSMVTPRNL